MALNGKATTGSGSVANGEYMPSQSSMVEEPTLNLPSQTNALVGWFGILRLLQICFGRIEAIGLWFATQALTSTK